MSRATIPSDPATWRVEPESVLGEKYKVSRLLGAGGMGAVYEAENTWTRRRVAIKVMRPEYACEPELVQRFLREAQSAAQIDHPNVVSVLDLGRDPHTGALFIVQEYLVGKELRTLLAERGALPPEEALALILPVVDGLVAAHALDVVHRDLKPENIFLTRSRTGRVVPKLIDFGIAKALHPRENEFRTMVGHAMGTPAYMSPEQARGELDIDARTDVWSIGVVLYEALSGRIPFETDDNPLVMLAHVLTREPIGLESVAPSVAPELCAAVTRALQRERADRYPDMLAFYDALAATPLGRRVRDTLGRRGSADLTPAPEAPAVEAAARDEPKKAPSRAPWLVVAVAGVMLVLGLAIGLARRGSPAPTPPRAASAAQRPAPIVEIPPVAQPAPLMQPAPLVQPVSVVAAEPVGSRAGRRPRRREASQRGANGAAIIE